ncbi:late embryogenesis abundant protein 1 [Diospyros lotus]|uniref:late embryogenesis abundant protein 1 n=1 Tax=Diospyros lotus TaxID=55363 RepID=UPI002258B493|nr:late embryogenesis abundant protein 1 [Diospyros lotus]
MSSAQLNAGQTRSEAQAKTEELVNTAQNTADKACDKMADSSEEAQRGKEQSASFLQQTGEQVMSMAQGAIDGVKNTLGMNERSK